MPIESKALKGMDSLLSIVQMPAGVPVGTLAIGVSGAVNAGLLAAEIVALADEHVREQLLKFREVQTENVARPSRSRRAVTLVGIVGGGQLGMMLAEAGARTRARLPDARPGAGLARLAGRTGDRRVPTTTRPRWPSSPPPPTS